MAMSNQECIEYLEGFDRLKNMDPKLRKIIIDRAVKGIRSLDQQQKDQLNDQKKKEELMSDFKKKEQEINETDLMKEYRIYYEKVRRIINHLTNGLNKEIL